MVHYRRGKQLSHRRHSRWYVRRGLAILVCFVLVSCLLKIGVLEIVPQNLANTFASPRQQLGVQASHKHAGSSGPPPQGVVSGLSTIIPAAAATPATVIGCHLFATPHTGLSTSAVPELQKLALFEQACGGALAERSSFFVPTPATVAQAQSSSQAVAATLLAYAHFGIKPLVFMEPDDVDGNNLDLAAMAKGTYDSALNTYFATLKSAGITSTNMGTWVYLPEGNLPVWSTTDPNIYASVITDIAQMQKSYFPGSLASIMLDSESYAPGRSWGQGTYVSLMPYVQNIPVGVIDSFGLQGFPWAAPANQASDGSVYDPTVYLRTDFATEAAQKLGIKDIWFNTGTFSEMYAGQAGATVTNTSLQRQTMLRGVIKLAQAVKAQGYSTSIHLFSENKAKTDEATDWSYWATTPGDSPGTAVFVTFAHDAAAAGIAIWIYDS